MQKNKNYGIFLTVILFVVLNLFITSDKIFSQDNQQDADDVILDSINTKENLLDSNTVYQSDFDSLSNQGDWVKINRSDLIQDVSGDSDENIVEDNDGQVVKVIYIWRPRNVDSEWNPYSNGRWVFTYRGWVWESDYDWGWACYNYGRWYWSGYYGWCWLPGRVWAPNWCVWRTHGSYCGWYPTCPRIHWRHHGHWVRNHTFRSKTKNWVFVDKKDLTKKIDKTNTVKPEKNGDILRSSTKMNGVNTYVTDKKTIKYNGPDVSNISKETGVKITPEKVKITKVVNNGTRNGDGTTRITKSGNPNNTRETKQQPTRNNGSYNPPRNDGSRNNNPPPRNPEGHHHNNPSKGSGPSKGSNPPSKNNGSKGDGSKKNR